MSVTTWNHKHFEQFDADKIIQRMMKSKNWPNSKYYGQSPDEIKAGWEKNRATPPAAARRWGADNAKGIR